MNGADYLILGVLAVSMLLGMYRGFVRESIALLAWLGGLWLAWRYATLVEPFLGMLFAVPLLGERLDAVTLGFAAAVIATVFIGKKMPVHATAPTERI